MVYILEVFKVMVESSTVSFVGRFGSVIDIEGHGRGTAREDSNLVDSLVGLLQLHEQVIKVGSSKVGTSSASSEQGLSGNFYKSRFADIQHGGSQIVLVLQFGDEDMDFQDSDGVFLFDFSNDIDQPFELFLVSADPEEVAFSHVNGSVVLDLVDDIFQQGSKWRHTDTSSNQHANFKGVPVLVTFSVRTIDKQLG